MEFSENKSAQKKLTPLLATEKIRNWCAYRERSQYEATQKLYEFGLTRTEVEQIISQLIEENFLNEERFAMAFASGKFKIKRWGRIKIRIELRSKKVSDYCIKKALNQIDEEDYLQSLRKILEHKKGTIPEKNQIKKNYKLFQYAASKGYESDIIGDILKEMATANKE